MLASMIGLIMWMRCMLYMLYILYIPFVASFADASTAGAGMEAIGAAPCE